MNTIRVALVAALLLAGSGRFLWAQPGAGSSAEPQPPQMARMDDAKFKDWLDLWSENIVNDARNRYCDKANGEDIGWLMTPFMRGFYYGYMATKDTKWVDMLVDWADSWIKRGVKEPDGYLGWPKVGAAGTAVDKLDDFNADSLLGEAMVLRWVALMSGEILKTPALKAKYGAKADSYIKLAEQVFEKWDKRGAWRPTEGGGMMTVVLPFGLEGDTSTWTAGYETRNAPGNGFSHPDNKANLVACWLLAMSDVTGKPSYKERAEKWFKLMQSRMKLKGDGTYEIWNYWEPAGPWDYKPDKSPKHWVGVHPNGGYYFIDTEGIVDAYQHGLVFAKADIEHLSATALATQRYWSALVPYNRDIQKQFEETLKPDSWGGLGDAPWYLYLQVQLGEARQAGGTTYYVDQGNPGARDDNPGTAREPWKTITKAAQTVAPGDTVIVKAGTYAEEVMVMAPHAGRPGSLITFKANPGDTVVIEGGKNRTFGFRVGVSYVRIEGFEIVNVTGHGILVGWSDGSAVGVQIVNNNVHDCGSNPDTAAVYYAGGGQGLIEGDHLHHNAGDGITFSSDDITIRNNRIEHNEVDGMKGGGGGRILIEDNIIHNMTSAKNHGDGMQLMGMKGTLVVRNNTVWDCTQDIYCDDYSEQPGQGPWGDVYIYNNVVFNSAPGPEGIGGFYNGIVTGTRYNAWRSLTVCNNTLANCNDGSGGLSVRVVGPTAQKINVVRVFNNLFCNSLNGTEVHGLASRGGKVEMDYNVYCNQWRNWYLGEGWTDLDRFRAAHPGYEQHSFYSTEVKFVRDKLTDPDYRLAAGSAPIGKGTILAPIGDLSFGKDRDGRPRPSDSPWDMGAYQYVPQADANR